MAFFRRNEFKPDKMGSSLLSKLYVPKPRREKVLRWVLYGAVLTVLSLVQDVVMCRLRVLGATTDLVTMGIFLLAMTLNSEDCAVFSLVASVLYFFSGMALGPYCILFITGLCVVLNIFRVSFLRRSLGTTLFLAGLGLLIYELLLFVLGLFLGLTTPARLPVFCMTTLLSLPAMLLIYPIYHAISNIGGNEWID